MTRINADSRLLFVAVTFLAPACVQSATWTSPLTLSTGGQGWEAAAAIDGNGNSVAVWDERESIDQLWSRSRPAGSNWGAVNEISPALQTTSVLPAVRMSTAGLTTAVWSDSNGVWTADRPPAAGWNAPRLVLPGVSSPIFLMNSQGAAAIIWAVGGPRSTSSSVMAIVRPAGGSWSAQQVITTGVHVALDHAGIGTNGALVVTWESYNAVCKKYGCALSAYDLHASRQNPGSGAWVDSGSLLGPDGSSHDARVALDAAGGAILVVLGSSGSYMSATQGNAGGAWSAFATAVTLNGLTITTGVASDDAGQVTLVYEAIGFSGSQVFAVNGTIAANTWSPPAVISGSDTTAGQIYFAVAPGGAALAIWLSSGSNPVVHAVTRSTGTGIWSTPAGVSGPGSEISPEAVAVNSAGNAVVIYSGYDTNSVHTEYVTDYQP